MVILIMVLIIGVNKKPHSLSNDNHIDNDDDNDGDIDNGDDDGDIDNGIDNW